MVNVQIQTGHSEIYPLYLSQSLLHFFKGYLSQKDDADATF